MGRPTETTEGVWLGPELTIGSTIIVEPLAVEPDRMRPALIPVELEPVRLAMTGKIVFDGRTTVLSTRSRYAQLGGEFPKAANGIMGQYLNSDEQVADLPFLNHSFTPIELAQGEVCRLMHRQGPPLQGRTLLDLIDSGKIEMSGEIGRDWWVPKDPEGTPVGVGLYLDEPEQWLHPQDTPVRTVGATTESFRTDMQAFLQPIKPTDQPRVRISQTTSTLLTSADLMAFLDQEVLAALQSGVRIANPRHINTPALYGGYPKKAWPIRTETLSTRAELHSKGEGLPRKAVIATFYSVKNPPS